MPALKARCEWIGDDPLMLRYHDEEWGMPVHDDRLLFEHLCLAGAQAGLSWSTILRRREGYQRAFDRFDPRKIARYTPARLAKLLADPGIIRNRAKVKAFIANAKATLAVQKEFGSLDAYLWQFVKGKPIVNRLARRDPGRTQCAESEAMSKDLKARGFQFAGSTICYAFMQTVGMVNDHLTPCYRHRQCR
jgi:DNA-3-methyladenine glycosylase I